LSNGRSTGLTTGIFTLEYRALWNQEATLSDRDESPTPEQPLADVREALDHTPDTRTPASNHLLRAATVLAGVALADATADGPRVGRDGMVAGPLGWIASAFPGRRAAHLVAIPLLTRRARAAIAA
jgi:hypothetical protein